MSENRGQPQRFSNQQVATILADVADRMQILGANRFRVIAFQNAAETIGSLGTDINLLHAQEKLATINGVGQGIAAAISELLSTGSVAEFEELRAKVPDGVVEMIHVPDVGPKTARRLWEELGITSIAALQAAAEAGQIRVLKGFGAKSEQKILKGIEYASRRQDDRVPIGDAKPMADAIVNQLLERVPSGAIEKIEVAGSLRRWRETIGDLDILVVSRQPEDVMSEFRTLPVVSDVLGAGPTKSSVLLTTGLQADLRVVEAKHWGAALVYFTGSKEHNVPLRELALRQGWSLNEYGMTSTGDGADEQKFFTSEEELYDFLGLAWIAPELRENRGEIEAAQKQNLPELICLADMQGELHGHTTRSDGTASLEEMARSAMARGYRYWAVCDHSIGLGVVSGLDADALEEQAREIADLNKQWQQEGVDFRLLRGIEVEILADGSLALADETLAALDVVVASIHSGQRQDRQTITERCIKAIRNPHVDLLGHATGRLLGSRLPSDIDLEAVLTACAETGTVPEINAHPSRLDLNDAYAKRAIELGCMVAINSDAHSRDGMEIMPYGIGTARRAWITARDVVNTYNCDDMLALLKDRRS